MHKHMHTQAMYEQMHKHKHASTHTNSCTEDAQLHVSLSVVVISSTLHVPPLSIRPRQQEEGLDVIGGGAERVWLHAGPVVVLEL